MLRLVVSFIHLLNMVFPVPPGTRTVMLSAWLWAVLLQSCSALPICTVGGRGLTARGWIGAGGGGGITPFSALHSLTSRFPILLPSTPPAWKVVSDGKGK